MVIKSCPASMYTTITATTATTKTMLTTTTTTTTTATATSTTTTLTAATRTMTTVPTKPILPTTTTTTTTTITTTASTKASQNHLKVPNRSQNQEPSNTDANRLSTLDIVVIAVSGCVLASVITGVAVPCYIWRKQRHRRFSFFIFKVFLRSTPLFHCAPLLGIIDAFFFICQREVNRHFLLNESDDHHFYLRF